MDREPIDDETLMAYADGELDADAAAMIETAAREDAGIAARLAVFTGTRDALASAAALRKQEPVPGALAERAQSIIAEAKRREDESRVVPFPVSGKRDFFRPAAIAAGFAALGLIGGYLIANPGQDASSSDLRFAILDTPAITEALGRIPTGERLAVGTDEISLIATFRNAEDELCREFEVDSADAMTVVSVACWSGDRWEPTFAVVAAGTDDTSYAPASSFETLDAYLTAIGAEAPMSPDEERAALATVQN